MKKNSIRIVTVLIIVAIILTIWLVKNNNKIKVETNQDDVFALNVTKPLDLEKYKSMKLPMILDFGAEQCSPCQSMWEDLVAVNKEMIGKAIVKFHDVWEYPELAQDFPFSLIPTQFFITKDGKPFIPKKELNILLEYVQDNQGNVVYTYHVGPLTKAQMLLIIEEMK